MAEEEEKDVHHDLGLRHEVLKQPTKTKVSGCALRRRVKRAQQRRRKAQAHLDQRNLSNEILESLPSKQRSKQLRRILHPTIRLTLIRTRNPATDQRKKVETKRGQRVAYELLLPVPIVVGSEIWIREDLVGFSDLLETSFSVGRGVFVRVELRGKRERERR